MILVQTQNRQKIKWIWQKATITDSMCKYFLMQTASIRDEDEQQIGGTTC